MLNGYGLAFLPHAFVRSSMAYPINLAKRVEELNAWLRS